jgi:predicted SnoaL-like aldol condensation-catalyzing enzyme
MKKRTLAAGLSSALFGLIFGAQALAQSPVVGVADPESLFTDADPLKHKNKQAALHIMRELLQCHRWVEDAPKYTTERYIQHNPNAADGRQGMVDFFTKVLRQTPTATCGKLTTPVVAVLADGDYVTVVMAREYDHPVNKGQKYSTTWFDMWRFVDGKADEHWDPATITPPAGN